ncbi:CbrC family protein [Paenibacillus prosopidis]|uniref:Uncharacterized protein CbrC (UPF0167 family) n=1 Tax=Paenibacillus prosopidis TaxID=630520 RepID=A0A368VG31_9BACL|nr:CbrC family protein [Paenibacillus prosopidis]RCW39603.1 uncharacterized protein CbrC (UPF0167 family) [Paenibacillus prosopidis]
MQNDWNFRYFDDPLRNAEFIESPCESCGSEENCLDGVFFDEPEFDRESVCMDCLVDGKVKVHIRDYLVEKLERNVKKSYPSELEDKVPKIVDIQCSELKKSPPIPWIQQNDWVVCCGEFAKYLGEWSQEKFELSSANRNGKEFQLSILEKEYRDRIEDEELFWEDIGNDTAIYVFECLKCAHKRAQFDKVTNIQQSYLDWLRAIQGFFFTGLLSAAAIGFNKPEPKARSNTRIQMTISFRLSIIRMEPMWNTDMTVFVRRRPGHISITTSIRSSKR